MNARVEQRVINTLQHVLLMLLVPYVAWLVANGTWYVIDSNASAKPSMIISSDGNTARSVTKNLYKNVPNYHLFGEVGRVAPVKKQAKPTEAPKTRLRLKLRGVFPSQQVENSGAIVEELGKSSAYYKVGELVAGSAKLDSVFHDRILLNRNGTLETLYFDEASENKSSLIARTPVVSPKNTRKEINTPEQFVKEATKRLADNPDQALKSVGLQATKDGYVYQGNNPMLSGLNLNKGDIIRSVNGHNLGDVKKDKSLMQSLYEQGSLEVEVVRDGASFYINYPLR